MYRIEFEPGDVGVFRTVAEIATAIKSGVITPKARIYHQATDKWLPIEFHPHYKAALEMAASGGAQAPSSPTSTSAPVVSSLTPSGPRRAIQIATEPPPAAIQVADPELKSESKSEPESEPEPGPGLEPGPEPQMIALAPPAPAPLALLAAPTEPMPEPRPVVRPPRLRVELSGRSRRPFRLALAGTVLVLSTHVGLSAAAAPWKVDLDIGSLPFLRNGAATVAPRKPAPAPATASVTPALAPKPALRPLPREPEAQGSPSFGASSAFAPSAPKREPTPSPAIAPLAAAKPAPVAQAKDSVLEIGPTVGEIAVGAPIVPAARPAIAGRITPTGLVARYQAAYAAARVELETGFRTSGFANAFAPEHLASPQGVRAARLSAGTASAYAAKYHRREAEIERAYADSFAVLGKQLGWSADQKRAWETRRVLQEKPEIVKLTEFLLQEIDSLYGVLAAEEGAYEIKDGAITFQDAKAARAYAELRPWLDRRTHQWADTASGPPTSAARVLRAIGSTKLPEGGAF